MIIQFDHADLFNGQGYNQLDWTFLQACAFGYPSVSFQQNSYSDTVISDAPVFNEIDCQRCFLRLEFPNQPHFCEGAFVTTLNVQMLEYYPECRHCFSVLAHPDQPHRCPDAIKTKDQKFPDVTRSRDQTIQDVLNAREQRNVIQECSQTVHEYNTRIETSAKQLNHDTNSAESDWYTCNNCACACTDQSHQCSNEGYGIVEATNILLSAGNGTDFTRRRRMKM